MFHCVIRLCEGQPGVMNDQILQNGSRRREAGRPWRPILIAAFSLTLTGNIAMVVAGEVTKPPLGFPSAAAADQRLAITKEAKAILGTLTDADFKVYGRSGEQSNWIAVYRVADREVWRKCAELLAERKKEQGWRKIHIQFMDDEVWIDLGSGTRRRGEERQLGSFLIE